jgi:hypothetical protein
MRIYKLYPLAVETSLKVHTKQVLFIIKINSFYIDNNHVFFSRAQRRSY